MIATTTAPARDDHTDLADRPVEIIDVDEVQPSPENEQLYRPVHEGDPEIHNLAVSIGRDGVLESLVVTEDGYILSGHRRHAAAMLAGLEAVPCRVYPIRRADDLDRFVRLLREFNRQRNKTTDELIREEVVTLNPEVEHRALAAKRAEIERQTLRPADVFAIRGVQHRSALSDAKRPFLEAVQRIIDCRRVYWPVSDRQIHYALLNAPPLIHAGKPASVYRNDQRSYKRLVDLLTRARLEGEIDMEAIADETRPMSRWSTHQTVQSFVRNELDLLFCGYWRDLLQDQQVHIEIFGEKLTIASIINPVARRFGIPTTIGRGYSSLPPRWEIAQRFQRSGKSRLVMLIVADFDPDGEEIAQSLARSLRDDFGIQKIDPIKVALTADQVRALSLPPTHLKAKSTSSRYGGFVSRHGSDVYELEAIEPERLATLLTEAVQGVLDIERFNAQMEAEKQDAMHLAAVRKLAVDAMAGLEWGGPAA